MHPCNEQTIQRSLSDKFASFKTRAMWEELVTRTCVRGYQLSSSLRDSIACHRSATHLTHRWMPLSLRGIRRLERHAEVSVAAIEIGNEIIGFLGGQSHGAGNLLVTVDHGIADAGFPIVTTAVDAVAHRNSC